MNLSRRHFVLGGVSALLAGCFDQYEVPHADPDPRLTARPRVPTEPFVYGESALDLEIGRDGLLYVPSSYTGETAVPLVVLLHGAGGSASEWRGTFQEAETRGFVALAPDSRSGTWDKAQGDFGQDVIFIDAALAATFSRCRIDPSRILLAGFSDGAGYALSLGLSNGDLFGHLAAFSPGFAEPGELVGTPRVFVSHGTGDGVISVASSRDRIVPYLRGEGYDVRYEEFPGGHEVPRVIFEDTLEWFAE